MFPSSLIECLASCQQGRALSSCGMDEGEQDQHEERLREVFQSFDASGAGALSPAELAELCQALQLDEATPALLHALLEDQDHSTARVEFNQFKDALIRILSPTIEAPPSNQETCATPVSPEVHPKFVRGNKRYGRRSIPELIDPAADFSAVTSTALPAEDPRDNDEATVPRKRERWNAHNPDTEEYEAEGQLHLWNPDDTGVLLSSSGPLEERLREACRERAMPWEGSASHHELLVVCEHLGLEVTNDVFQRMSSDGVMSVQEFASRVLSHSNPPTPSASTPYRQLKRHHSTQPFDETGRRVATSSAMTSTIGMRLFSSLDDGTGYTPVEHILDAWMEEGIENSTEILQALDFNLDGKLSLSELTVALENELLTTKNGIHQAALASFKAEIRHLLECVDRELREKEKIRSDLEKAEKLKTQLSAEVDERHSAIEHINDLNLRKLEQDHKEKLAAVRTALLREMDQMQQQAGLQREELEKEVAKIREDETFLRDHLSITVKENRRIEVELLDSTEKLVEAEILVSKLQKNLDSILKEKFGDLDPGSAEFFLQEERLQQLRSGYEKQCRELQDRIDELQAELQEFHSLGRTPGLGTKPSLLEEFESKSPGMESDPGIGSEEGQPFNMSLEAEMMLEQLKEQYLIEMENIRAQLESKVIEFDQKAAEQRAANEEQKEALTLQHQEQIQTLKEEMATIQCRAQELQEFQDLERASLEKQQQEELDALRQELLQTHTHVADLEDQITTLETQRAEAELRLDTEREELKELHVLELRKLEVEQKDLIKVRLEEDRKSLLEERAEVERKRLEEWEKEKVDLQRSYEEAVKAKVEELSVRCQAEREELEMRLSEVWEKERTQLSRQSSESLRMVLEEEMRRLGMEQEARECELLAQWEVERAQLQDSQAVVLTAKLAEEQELLRQQHEQSKKKLTEEWEEERRQLEESCARTVQERVDERVKVEAEKEELEKKLGKLMELEENHRETMRDLSAKHSEEKDKLSSLLGKLQEEIVEERKQLEDHFSQRIKEVETRFLGDQEAVSQRFQAEVFNLEQYYHNELKTLSESHAEQNIKWEAEKLKALWESEEEIRILQVTIESLDLKLMKEQERLKTTEGEVEKSSAKNKELQEELKTFMSLAQTKEIELSRQLDDLHSRLQENLDIKDKLLAQAGKEVLKNELMLKQVVEDLKLENAELRNGLSELEARYTEELYCSKKQHAERNKLLSDGDVLRAKMEELERLLQQTVEDFALERQELEDAISDLEVKLEENLSSCELQENEKVALIEERHRLNVKIHELTVEFDKLLESKSTVKDKEVEGLDREVLMTRTLVTVCPEEQKQCIEHTKTCDETDGNDTVVTLLEVESVAPAVQVEITEYPCDLVSCGQHLTVAPNDQFILLESAESSCLTDECPEITSASDEVFDNVDNRVVEETNAIEYHKQNDDVGVEAMTVSKDTEALTENIIVSVEASEGEVNAIIDNRQVFVGESTKYFEDQEPAHYNIDDEDSCYREMTPTDSITKSSIPEEKPEDAVDQDMGEASPGTQCHGKIRHLSSEWGTEYNDAGEDELDCDQKNASRLYAVTLEVEPQNVTFDEKGSSFLCQVEHQCHDHAVETSVSKNTNDPGDCSKDDHFLDDSQSRQQEMELLLEQQPGCEKAVNEQDFCAHEVIDMSSIVEENVQDVCAHEVIDMSSIVEKNLLLQSTIAHLQHKTDLLESLLVASNEEMAAGQQLALEENSILKAEMLTLMEQADEMEVKTSELTDLQISYEECVCENVQLAEQNYKLQKRILGLEKGMHIIQDFQDQHVALVDEIVRMREENCKLTTMVSELERQCELLLARQQGAECSEEMPDETFLELNFQLEARIQAASELEDCCTKFEKQNGKCRRALANLQDKSLSIHESMQAHRRECSRLAEENLLLRRKISTLKEEDLKETHEETLLKLEHLRKEKNAAQKAAESFKKQISELRLRSKQLENENSFLAQKNAENAAGVEELGQQLEELLRQKARKEAARDQQSVPAEERAAEMAACVSALEAELTKALEGNALLEEGKAQHLQQLSVLREKILQERQTAERQNQGLCTQISKAQERIQAQDETLQSVSSQSARLKSDLRVSQQEKEALKLEVMSLHKQLQNANDKNQVLEKTQHSSGSQSSHKKLYRDKLARITEQEQDLLRQENKRLQMELHNTKGDLLRSREKVRQLETSVLSLKQQKQQSQSSLVKALEQDKIALKQELEALQKELLAAESKGCEDSKVQRELLSLRQENEGLKSQVASLNAKLIESLQSELGRLLPPSPHRLPGERRGPHRGGGDDHSPENMQQGAVPEQRAAHGDGYRRIGGL